MQTMQVTGVNEVYGVQDRNIDYASLKQKAIANQPTVVSYPLGAFDFGRNRTLKLNGHIMPISERSYDNFIENVLKAPKSFVDDFRAVTNEKAELRVLSDLKHGLSQKKGEKVTIIADVKGQQILGFGTKDLPYVSNEAFLKLFEMTMDKYPSLTFRGMNVNEQGSMVMDVMCKDVVSFGANKVGEMERFLGGLEFRNSGLTGTNISEFQCRLICDNGMTTDAETLQKFAIDSSNADNLKKYIGYLDKMSHNHFIDKDFGGNIKKAEHFVASVAELHRAAKMMTDLSDVATKNIDHYLPISETDKWLRTRGVNVGSLSAGQKRNCPTQITVWDLVNKVTHFATHDTDHNINRPQLQKFAGNMFARKIYDGENIIVFN